MIDIRDHWSEGRLTAIDPKQVKMLTLTRLPLWNGAEAPITHTVHADMSTGNIGMSRTFEFANKDDAEAAYDLILKASQA